MNNRSKVEAHSQSINKIVSRFENEFDVKAEGIFPKEKLESLIAQLKYKTGTDVEDDIDALIREVFSIGVSAGFYRALSRFMDGKITTRKVRNKESWNLYSSSKVFKISKKLPSTKHEFIKAEVVLPLAEYGFEYD